MRFFENRFRDRSVIVTGAASGFGRAIAERFAAEGARVLLADLDEGSGKDVTSAIRDAGGTARFVRTDVSRASDVDTMIETAQSEFGGVDVLVNNAGFTHRSQRFEEVSEDEYDRVFAVNTKGVFLGCQRVIPVMREAGGGVIVNTASIGAVAPRPGVTPYNATKGAVVTMTRGLAVELARFQIRVNAVNPVASDTNFMLGALGDAGMTEEGRKAVVAGIPLGRLTGPADVAASVTFLASDDAAFLTGVCLDVDGGRSIS